MRFDMGMYTEVALGVKFKTDAPHDVIDTVASMARGEGHRHSEADHPLFDTDRWAWMLTSGGSYYFDAKPVIKFDYDNVARQWYLTVWTNIKNYSSEWEKFLDYIGPYVECRGYVGHYRYEESKDPTLLYAEGGEIQMVEFNRNKGDE